MDSEAHMKEEDEKVPKQEPKSPQDSLRLRSISPENQGLPCPLQSSTSSQRSDVLVSHPVTRLPSQRRRSFSGGAAQAPTTYNRAEHNIFLRMQRADPLSASSSGRSSGTKSPEDAAAQSPEKRGNETIVRQGDDDVEKEAAAQLSNIAYDTIKDTQGKS
jgi:hypothetical protein